MTPTVQQFAPLLALIRRAEARGDYNVVWGGIKPEDRPTRPLTTATIGQVLAWQDSIDHKYPSEACGAYQFMEATLREIYAPAGFQLNTIFGEATQDLLAVHLLKRRGAIKFLKGEITAEQFANNLAMEWASFPVVTDRQGHKRMVRKGESYYAGDGLNMSGVKPAEVLGVLSQVSEKHPLPAQTPEKASQTAKSTRQGGNLLESVLGLLRAIFRGKT